MKFYFLFNIKIDLLGLPYPERHINTVVGLQIFLLYYSLLLLFIPIP